MRLCESVFMIIIMCCPVQCHLINFEDYGKNELSVSWVLKIFVLHYMQDPLVEHEMCGHINIVITVVHLHLPSLYEFSIQIIPHAFRALFEVLDLYIYKIYKQFF